MDILCIESMDNSFTKGKIYKSRSYNKLYIQLNDNNKKRWLFLKSCINNDKHLRLFNCNSCFTKKCNSCKSNNREIKMEKVEGKEIKEFWNINFL